MASSFKSQSSAASFNCMTSSIAAATNSRFCGVGCLGGHDGLLNHVLRDDLHATPKHDQDLHHDSIYLAFFISVQVLQSSV
jgi:hypothetical protein